MSAPVPRIPVRSLAIALAAVWVVGVVSGPRPAPGATPAGTRPSAGDGTLSIAALVPVTGPLAPLRESLRVPVEHAVNEINFAGGVNGEPVALTTADEGPGAETAQAQVAELADAGVDALIGPAAPATVIGIMGDIRRARMLTCSGADTLAPVTTESSRGLYFRTAPGPALQGRALAELVLDGGHRRISVLHRDDHFGDELAGPLLRRLEQGDARVVADITYDPAQAGADRHVRRALERDPEAIVVVGFDDDAARVVANLVDRGVGPDRLPIYVPDTVQSSTFATAVDPADPARVAGIQGTAPAPAPAGVSSPFHAVLVDRGIDPIFSWHTYDCTILTALAALGAGTDDPDEMKRAFRDNLRGEVDCDTFAACKELLEQDRTIHWRGASSTFERFRRFQPGSGAFELWSFDATGQPVTSPPDLQIEVP